MMRPRMTGAEWQALPYNARRYIMMLETDCDPSGTIRSEMFLRDQVEDLELALIEARGQRLMQSTKQHPWDSVAEVIVNVLIGFLISMLAYAWVINPLFHLHTNPFSSMGIVSIFTAFSLARQYVIRRAFNGKSPYAWAVARYRRN